MARLFWRVVAPWTNQRSRSMRVSDSEEARVGGVLVSEFRIVI